MMFTVELVSQAAEGRLESLHAEAQTRRLVNAAWRKRWAVWLIVLAGRLDAPTAPTLDGGQAAKA